MPLFSKTISKSKKRRRLSGGESLEDRRLLAFDPSPFEQEQLEHVNRMRLDPAGELTIFFDSLSPLNTFEPDGISDFHPIQDALVHFGVSGSALQTQWAQLVAAPPLAWNESLYDAAVLHSQLSVEQNLQAHRIWNDIDGDGVMDPGEEFIEPALQDRITDAGYNGSLFLENVYTFAESMIHGHAGFAIDWGTSDTGIQEPPGHRNNIMSVDVEEIGIGVIDNSDNIGIDDNETVGPFIITHEFGSQANYTPQILGVVWEDGFVNGYYEAGEGYGGVDITVVGNSGTFTTQTMSAGGYQIEVPAGTYEVIASDSVLGTYSFGNIVVGNQNVKVDFNLAAGPNRANLRPTAGDDTANVNGSEVINVLANDSDSDGTLDPTSVVIVTQPTSGSVSVNPQTGAITYTGGSATSDSFTYRVRDNDGASDEATVTLTIVANNVPPVATDASFTVDEDTSSTRSLAASVTDADGTVDWTSFTIVQQPTRGVVTFDAATQSFTYRGQTNFTGTDSFQYQVADDDGADSNVATVSLTVTDVNDAPTAVDDISATVSGGSRQIAVYLNDTDPDGNTANATIEIITAPASGTAVANGSSVDFTAAVGFTGVTTFTYQLRDQSDASSNTATVTVYVANPDTPWRNPVNPFDVDGNSAVGPIDALTVITYIGITDLTTGNSVPGLENAPTPFLDVNGNGQVDPFDALFVIGELPSGASMAPLSEPAVVSQTVAMQTSVAASPHAAIPSTTDSESTPLSPIDPSLRDLALADPADEPTADLSRRANIVATLGRWNRLPLNRRVATSESAANTIDLETSTIDALWADGEQL